MKKQTKLPAECELFNAARGSCAAVPRTAHAALIRLGRNLEAARIARKDTIQEMSARCFTTPMVICAIERGDPHVPVGVLATYMYMVDRHADLALLCHPGGSMLKPLRERAERAVKEFQDAMLEFVEQCGKV